MHLIEVSWETLFGSSIYVSKPRYGSKSFPKSFPKSMLWRGCYSCLFSEEHSKVFCVATLARIRVTVTRLRYT